MYNVSSNIIYKIYFQISVIMMTPINAIIAVICALNVYLNDEY